MNRYIIIKMVSTLYEQARTRTLKVGNTLKIKNGNRTRKVSEIHELDNETYRITFENGDGISVSPTIEDEWEKVRENQNSHQLGGKKKRKSRRNKKTKRRKSQRHR